MRVIVDTAIGDQLTIRDKYVTIKSKGVHYYTMLKYVHMVKSYKKKGLERYYIYEYEVDQFEQA